MSTPKRWHSAHGGRYTIWNRIVCFLVGHDRLETPTVETSAFRAWLCTRCNETALFQDVTTNEYSRELADRRP